MRQPSVLNVDFNQWAATYDGPRFNFIHCDFPSSTDTNSLSGYIDSSRLYYTLCKSLCDHLGNIAADQCHVMFWFPVYDYTLVLNYFREHSDITFDPVPLVWVKSDNVGLMPEEGGPRRIYETAFFGGRGNRKALSPVANAYAGPTDRGFHMSVKPEPVLRHFFRACVNEATVMLDPACGSGSSLRAAEDLWARSVLGLEINNDFCEQANRDLANARTLRMGRT